MGGGMDGTARTGPQAGYPMGTRQYMTITLQRRIGESGGTALRLRAPHEMWRDGFCWGFTDDPDQVAREKDEMKRYALTKRGLE